MEKTSKQARIRPQAMLHAIARHRSPRRTYSIGCHPLIVIIFMLLRTVVSV
jgi:hypothetical protein